MMITIPKTSLYKWLRLSSKQKFAGNVVFLHSKQDCEALSEWIKDIEQAINYKPTKGLLNEYAKLKYVFTFCPDCMSKNQFKLILPAIFDNPLEVLNLHKEFYNYENRD